ncbi:hypothetical protein PAUR_b0627 [Pseudoalteromonas aurantia 208]|uniref:Orphan protein n=1 Tax=Pseudoalteromonas aurantia 208 TaxID=1314867 RepID=A0ABR9ELG5_9GAMM|nr:hypothetical protein [Pseudoalteromonas aurantia 208]
MYFIQGGGCLAWLFHSRQHSRKANQALPTGSFEQPFLFVA